MTKEKLKVYINGNQKIQQKAKTAVTAHLSSEIRYLVDKHYHEEHMYEEFIILYDTKDYNISMLCKVVKSKFSYTEYTLDEDELLNFVKENYDDSFVRSVVKNVNKWGIERGGQPYTKMTNQSAATLLGLEMEFAEPIDYSTRATDKQISFAAGLAKKAGFKLTKDILTKEEAGAVIGFFHHKSDSEEGKVIVRSITEKL